MNKKETERAMFAWQYGGQAKKDGKPREVPEFWLPYAEAWLRGYDGLPFDSEGMSGGG